MRAEQRKSRLFERYADSCDSWLPLTPRFLSFRKQQAWVAGGVISIFHETL